MWFQKLYWKWRLEVSFFIYCFKTINFNKFIPKDYELIELSNYLKTEINSLLSTLPPTVSETYKKRIYNSLNAHNSHNTANLCCGQDLDFIEQKNLRLGKNIDISTTIDMEKER